MDKALGVLAAGTGEGRQATREYQSYSGRRASVGTGAMVVVPVSWRMRIALKGEVMSLRLMSTEIRDDTV